MAASPDRAGWVRAFLIVGVAAVVGAACSSSEPSGGATTGATTGALVMLDARSGRRVWTARPAASGHLLAMAGTGSELVLAFAGECLETTSPSDRLVALDAASGERRWERPPVPVASRTMRWAVSPSSDAAAAGVVVTPGAVGGPDTRGLSARTGRRVWSIPSETFLGVSEQSVFTSTPDGDHTMLVAHDRRTGRPRWTFPASASPEWTATFDVVAADRSRVVVANGDYNSRSGDRPGSPTIFFVLDAATGRQVNSFVAADPTFRFSDMTIADGALLYAEQKSVVARDLVTGAVRWSRAFDDAGEISAGMPAVVLNAPQAGNRVLVNMVGQGFRLVVALDVRTGETVWQRHGALVRSTGRGLAVLGEDASPLVGVDTRAGTQRWHRTVPQIVGDRSIQTTADVAAGRVALSPVCDPG